ncbi:Voltage-dependent calcium channel alpha-2/delta subunit conserved region [Trinorchestia longiramus]|nr:Voltage-dependent calcium channel alpha-2/delta subunit conserved region [Trinorchestia longiramus]
MSMSTSLAGYRDFFRYCVQNLLVRIILANSIKNQYFLQHKLRSCCSRSPILLSSAQLCQLSLRPPLQVSLSCTLPLNFYGSSLFIRDPPSRFCPAHQLLLLDVKTANLLGVAGTDVPIDEIAKLAPPYQLGVNGYSFIVNQNGHVLYHPDLRPVHEESNAEFQDILKPNYNSVDFTEVELPAANGDLEVDEPRYNHSTLMGIRQMMIKQEALFFIQAVKLHMDNMKRVVTRRQEYHAFPIEDTPFSLGIALPNPSYAFHGEIEISRTEEDVTHYFRNGSWNVHPEWVYCQYKYEKPFGAPYLETPESLLLHFLNRARMQGWKWRSTRTIPPTNPDKDSSKQQPQGDEEKRKSYFCDKTLIQSLLFDAKVTDVYNESVSDSTSSANQDYYNSTGINTAFVATRSGLTRWQDTPDAPPSDGPHFLELHNRAIDEVWYRRAVDYYEKDKDAYVYSVPFDAGTRNLSEVLMTVTRAVYVRQDDMNKAPVAVVGVTVTLAKFIDHFINGTKKCSSPSCKENKLCTNSDLDCYLLDDSGFIIASEEDANTGRFFGEIEGTIMNSLVMSDVYNKVKVFDYQAVCLDIVREGSMASILLTPLQLINWTVKWLAANFFWVMVQTQLYQLWDPNEAWAYLHGSNLSPYAFVEPAKGTPSKQGDGLQRKHRAYAEGSYRGRQAFSPAGHYRPYSHGVERTHRAYAQGSYGNTRPFAQGEYGQRGTGAHGNNDYGYAQRGPGRTSSFANNENNYNNYPDTVDYDSQLPFATEGALDYELHGETQEESEQKDTGSSSQRNGVDSTNQGSPAYQTVKNRNRRYTETVVAVIKGSNNEQPYDIVVDYETAITNVSLIEREEIAAEAVDYDDLFDENGEDEDAEYHDEFLAEDYDDTSEDYVQSPDAEGFPQLELAYINKTRPRPCDKQVYLYNLNNDKLKDTSGVFETVKGKLSNCHTNGCGRPFSVQKIMKTNLVLIVVDNRCPCESQKVDIEPSEVPYPDDLHCDHLLSNKYRRRPKECYNYHPDEWPMDFEEVPRPPIPIPEERIKICAGCSYGPSVTCLLVALILSVWPRH